jgi:mono/diheme cytochrome c family protein
MKPTTALLAAAIIIATRASAVDYASQIAPILNQKCAECHNAKRGKTKGDFAIDRLEDMQKQVKAGKPEQSSLVFSITLPDDDDDVMPPKGKNRVSPAQVALIKQWITEGASFEKGGGTPPPAAPATPTTTATPAAPAGENFTNWTNSAGTTLEAAFIGMEGADKVLLKVKATGQVHRIPLASLSAESQELAKRGGK